ncbi:MAG: permease [Planctomycetota bacterium]
MEQRRYQWAASGDVNAFFGLMLDNIAGLLLLVSLLNIVFGFPVTFSLAYMVPGTALGVMVGDLLFFWLAFRYAKRSGKTDVTAMPLGLDTPSTIGMIFLVLGPAYATALQTEGATPDTAAMAAWKIGMCAIFISGIVKGVLAFFSNWLHRVFPRAGLLGSLAAIAVVLIAFIQTVDLAVNPIVGFAALAIVLATLIARQELPFKVPGALGAVLVGTTLFYLLYGVQEVSQVQFLPAGENVEAFVWFPTEWTMALRFEWLNSFGDTLPYLGYIIPFAIATVIGGIDCTESAASVGDEYNTGQVIGIEAFATMLAACFGGVIQTTPYIGHPAYKAMGGRALYTLATALFVGGAGLIGYFSILFYVIPKEAVLPILVFIGIEITAQSYHATPRRHYAALAVACFPAIAKVVMIYLGQFSIDMAAQAPNVQDVYLRLSVLAGGFILTSLIWASATAAIIDRKFSVAAIYFAVGGMLTMFGLMHSPLNGDQMFMPWNLFEIEFALFNETGNLAVGFQSMAEATFTSAQKSIVIQLAVAYLTMALLMIGLESMLGDKLTPINSDAEYEKLI